ncbi:unnamed protein product [Rotaria socialis]|uniref:RING-type domain-containing protein n=1 Tax=Rotaria socialis TaxID=392032 RepID=A0A817USV4_9BILA|nr:unnamed protein product [Rotaria socialis]CAF4547540.1 unnamed protein product [Rotaria socialis]
MLVFRCPNRVYNAWKGPFPMKLNQFRNHLETSYKLFGYQAFLSSRFFFTDPEYVQIELGRNAIDQNIKNTIRVFNGHYSDGKLQYTLNRVLEGTIDKSNMVLYIRFAPPEHFYSEIRYPYDFQSFSTNTLRCIIQQLNVSSSEFMQWSEKSMYIKNIENIYNQNPKEFNRKVIIKCGILIGYLYRPTNEYFFPSYKYEAYRYHEDLRIFNASFFYTPSCSYIFLCIIVCLLFKDVVYLVVAGVTLIFPRFQIVHRYTQKQMKKANIDCVNQLDQLLLHTTNENNHGNHLFIVDNEYLAVLMVDLNEYREPILRQFYEDTPINIFPIHEIDTVRSDCIVFNNDHGSSFSFPTYQYNRNWEPADWLHERLMAFNEEYRYRFEQNELNRRREAERQSLLEFLTEEEAQYQQDKYGNDINRVLDGIRSASPRFIAEFRLSASQIANDNLLDETCTICREDYHVKQRFAQWPCPAHHMFHFDCMLDTLRAGDTCPLCRYPVAAPNLNSIERAFRSVLGRVTPNIFD